MIGHIGVTRGFSLQVHELTVCTMLRQILGIIHFSFFKHDLMGYVVLICNEFDALESYL